MPSGISFVVGNQAATNTTGATKQVTIPGGVSVGNAMFALYVGDQAITTAPTGWTLVRSGNVGSCYLGLYYRVCQTGDAGTNVVFGSTSTKTSVLFAAWSGCDASNPVASSAIFLESASGLNHVASTVTPATTWVATFAGAKDVVGSTTTAWTKPTAQTSRANILVTGGSQTMGGIADSAGDLAVATGGTWSGDVATDKAVIVTVALQPASTTTTVGVTADITSASWTASPALGTGEGLYSRLSDGDASTFIESAAAPSGLVYKGRLGAMGGAPNTAGFTAARAGGATSATAAFVMKQGATTVATRAAETLTDTMTTYTYTLTGPEKALVTDATTLDAQVTVTAS